MATGYDRHFRSPVEHLKLAAIVIPVIVVKGRLFEGRLNEASVRLMLDERGSSRLHWRGSDKWHLHTTVDVVTENELPRFVNARRDEAIHAARVIMDALGELQRCVKERNLEAWTVRTGPTGFIGGPRLLAELRAWLDSKEPLK
jgi:hypothetical protein